MTGKKRNGIVSVGLIGLISLFTFSCEWSKVEPIDEGQLPEVISFSDHIIPIFESKCITCHGGTVSPDLRRESAYFELTAGGLITEDDPSNPDNCFFYQKISGSGSMAQYASDLDRAYIYKWISQGAEDN